MVNTSGLFRRSPVFVVTYCGVLVGTLFLLTSEGSRAGLLSARYLLAGVICSVVATTLGKHAYRLECARAQLSDCSLSTS